MDFAGRFVVFFNTACAIADRMPDFFNHQGI
jgi:hypothetical protein